MHVYQNTVLSMSNYLNFLPKVSKTGYENNSRLLPFLKLLPFDSFAKQTKAILYTNKLWRTVANQSTQSRQITKHKNISVSCFIVVQKDACLSKHCFVRVALSKFLLKFQKQNTRTTHTVSRFLSAASAFPKAAAF